MSSILNERRKFFINALGFALVSGLILYTVQSSLAFFVGHSHIAQTGKINLIMQHQIDPDILFIGSSVAEKGFDIKTIEDKTNNTAYNMGIDGTKITNSRYVVDEFLEYSKNCKSIVIGMAFFSLGKNHKIHAPERFLAHKSNTFVKKNILKIQPDLGRKLYNVPFYSFIVANHTYYKNAFYGFKNLINQKTWMKDSLKGFSPSYRKYHDTRKEGKQLGVVPLDNKGVNSYKKIIEEIKAHDIMPTLVLMPMHNNGQEFFSNIETYKETAQQLAKDVNVEFYDFSDHDITSHTEYYYNNGHLNAKGAKYLSELLSDSLMFKK